MLVLLLVLVLVLVPSLATVKYSCSISIVLVWYRGKVTASLQGPCFRIALTQNIMNMSNASTAKNAIDMNSKHGDIVMRVWATELPTPCVCISGFTTLHRCLVTSLLDLIYGGLVIS